MTPEQLNHEAKRLLEDETFKLALENMRQEALEALTKVDAKDADGIRMAQANYNAVIRLSEELQRIIHATAPSKPQAVA